MLSTCGQNIRTLHLHTDMLVSNSSYVRDNTHHGTWTSFHWVFMYDDLRAGMQIQFPGCTILVTCRDTWTASLRLDLVQDLQVTRTRLQVQ